MIDVFIIFYWLISQLSVPLQCDIIIIIHPLRGIRHFGSYGRIGNSVFHPGIDSRLGFLPRFVVIRTIPFAPRTPYKAVAVASFNIEKVAISSGSTKSIRTFYSIHQYKRCIVCPERTNTRIQNLLRHQAHQYVVWQRYRPSVRPGLYFSFATGT